MDIFKLFFNHDLRLAKLAKHNANNRDEEGEAGLQDFMKPDPTYSKFYITGTLLEEKKFGLNTLSKSQKVLVQLQNVFQDKKIITHTGQQFVSVTKALNAISIDETIIIGLENQVLDFELSALPLNTESKIGHTKDKIRALIKTGAFLMYKEPARDGYDLHLFSKENIYDQLFGAFKPLVSEKFRFFSINNKRMRSKQHFYFETWTLDNPPHGAEEVFPETVL